MIDSEGKIQNHLLSLTNELDDLGEKFLDKIKPEQREEFKKDVDSIREDLFHIINVSKKVREIIEKSY